MSSGIEFPFSTSILIKVQVEYNYCLQLVFNS